MAGLCGGWEQYKLLAGVVCFKLAFYGLLRPGELLGLTAANVAVPDSEEAAVLIVKNPKKPALSGEAAVCVT